jgi:glucose/arabinose dehydrogenase
VEPAFPNLTFDEPLMLIPTPAPGSTELFLGTRQGEVYRFEDDQSATSATLVLDVTSNVHVYEDSGFLGLALHPEFGQAGSPNRGYLYVYYTSELDPDERFLYLLRYTIPDGSLVADLNSELILIRHRYEPGSHFGGDMFFGPDGFLYLAIGDQFNYDPAQEIDTNFEGKVLRIDVDQDLAKSHVPLRSLPLAGSFSDEFIG